jgi:hypothetical protein
MYNYNINAKIVRLYHWRYHVTDMLKNSTIFAISIVILVIGLVMLLVGESTQYSELVWIGGSIALLAVAIQTYQIASQKKE